MTLSDDLLRIAADLNDAFGPDCPEAETTRRASDALRCAGEWTTLGVDHPKPRWYWTCSGNPEHVYSPRCARLWNTGTGTVIAEDITPEEWPTYGELLRWTIPIPTPPEPRDAT